MKRFKLGSAVLFVTCASLGSTAGVTAAGPADGPAAQASKTCRSVNTHNGGRATFITISGTLSCRRARRVAARANGKRYKALGFDCKKSGRPSRTGQLYGCGGTVNGKVSGIGFFYKKPSRAAAQISKKCRNVRTFNGGTVSLLFANKVSCRRARMVAKRANGRRFRAFGFKCTKSPLSGQAGRGFSCNRTKPGTGQGIAFSYKKG